MTQPRQSRCLLLHPLLPKLQRLSRLKELHPPSPAPELAVPTHDAPLFQEQHVREALFSFSPTSAAGLFGYRPFLLQQCARSESFHFVSTLTRAVNMLASGKAPMFLQPFLAGGVSIALAKPSRGVRPLCCGDPLRRLVAKCFCLGGKGEISQKFKGKNYGVGCPGGVEAVAHSLRDVLHRHRDSDLALLKIDFKNAFNLLSREAFVKASSEMFPGLERWTWWCYNKPPLLITTMKTRFTPSPVFNKVIPLVRSTFVAVSNLSSTKSLLFILFTRSGTWMMVELLAVLSC